MSHTIFDLVPCRIGNTGHIGQSLTSAADMRQRAALRASLPARRCGYAAPTGTLRGRHAAADVVRVLWREGRRIRPSQVVTVRFVCRHRPRAPS